MEALSILLLKVQNGRFISGFKVRGRGGGGKENSHLLFVDDIIVFCEASQEQVTFLYWLLMWFEVMLGLKINLEKSEMIPFFFWGGGGVGWTFWKTLFVLGARLVSCPLLT